LQAVEQTIVDERDNADPGALYASMVAALAANPALLDRLIAAVHAHRARTALVVDGQQSAVVGTEQQREGDGSGTGVMSSSTEPSK